MPSLATDAAVAAGVAAAARRRKQQQQNGLAPPTNPPIEPAAPPPGTVSPAVAAGAAGATTAIGVAGTGAALTGVGLPPALAAAISTELSKEAAEKLTKLLADAISHFQASRDQAAAAFVYHQLVTKFPSEEEQAVRAAAVEEFAFEAKFRAKMLKRLVRDLPAALMQKDAQARRDAVTAIFDREKRYTMMREDAMLARAIGRLEKHVAKRESPEGAYWKLSPHVKEHTPDCIAMGEKFWPWAAIEQYHPPLHPGCACSLLTLDQAVGQGLMARDQMPDVNDAIYRANQIKRGDYGDGGMAEAWLEESRLDLEELELRIPEGYAKGGEFIRIGGDRGDRARVRLPRSPLRARAEGRGRWAWVRGRLTHIPEADLWERRFGIDHYWSPAGSTNVYRNQRIVSEPGREHPGERRRAPLSLGTLSEEQQKAVKQLRAQSRRPAAAKAAKAAVKGGAPLSKGDGAEAVMALRESGWTMVGATPRGGERADLEFLNRRSGQRLSVSWDGQKVGRVSFEQAPPPTLRRRKADGPAASWQAHRMDALAWADELGTRHDAVVSVPSVDVDPALQDHAGRHEWAGDVLVGKDTPDDIEAAARARRDGRELTESEKRGVWSAMWVTAHEVAHGVNPIDEEDFDGANANLEEALAEEMAHPLAVERLRQQGQQDVLDWRDRHKDAIPVQGVYLRERAALGQLLTDAGIDAPGQRRRTVERLAFQTPPAERLDVLARLLHAQHPDEPEANWRLYAEMMMDTRMPRQAGGFESVIGDAAMSPGSRYGIAVPGARLSRGGTEIRTSKGMRRIEKLPLVPGVEGLTDGTAIASYRKGQKPTDGLTNADGSPKNFRYVDSRDRAKDILATWAGKLHPAPASPGTGDDDGSFWDDLDMGGGHVANWLKKLKGGGKSEPSKPSKVEKPPKPKEPEFIGGDRHAPTSRGPIKSYDRTRLELGKYAGGSNGAQWAFDRKGQRWLVKTYRGDENRIATELLANAVYRQMGAKVADAGTISVKGKPALTYPTLEGEVRDNVFHKDGPNEEVGRHFMVDALLANWDFAGMTDDNIMWDPEGKPFRVDQGGTFEYRAQGGSKPYGPVPTEVWTMLRKGQGKRASKVTEDQMRDQAREIAEKLTPQAVDKLVNAAPFSNEEMRERVRDNLNARVGWMRRFADGEEGLPEPLEGHEFWNELADSQGKFATRPEEADALAHAIEDPRVNDQLRAHGELDPDVKQTHKRLDGLLRDLKTSEDGYIYVPLSKTPGKGFVGKTFNEPGYLGGTTDETKIKTPAFMRILLPAGSHAAHVRSHLDGPIAGEPQVLLRRDSRIKVTGMRKVGGKTVIDAQAS